MHDKDRKVVELSLDDILPNRFQPRITFGEAAINDLAESIKEHGVIQPIVVRKINDKYEIIAGERRYKASLIAGAKTIPAIITDLNDKESAEIALIENVQREDLTPIEEAVSYKKILDMGYLTQEELSGKLGKQQSTISNKLRLLNLDEEVQEALLEKKISERHARSLLKLDEKDQRMMLHRIMAERLTVRRTDAEIEKLLNNKNTVIQESPRAESAEIEILDLEEKGEKNNMNQDMNNTFNIPTSPIVEENPNQGIMANTPQPAEANPMQTPANGGINPGFMDVDKIASTAADINVEKPVADLNSLLQPTPAPSDPSTPSAPTVDASIFGLNPAQPANTPSQMGNNDSTEEETGNNGKYFDLSGFVSEAPTPTEPTPTPEVAPTPQPEENKSSMFGINLEPKNPDFVGNVEAQTTNMNFDIPKPQVDTNNMNFDSFFTPEGAATTQPAQETPSETTPQDETTVVPEPTPIQPTQILNDVQNTQNVVSNVGPSQPTPESVQIPAQQHPTATPQANPTPNYTVPSNDELDSFLSSIDSTTPLSNTVAAANPAASTVAQPSVDNTQTQVPIQQQSVDVQSKMNEVTAIIQETKNKINALGIQVDIDEFDFDDMYQAIIKIDK